MTHVTGQISGWISSDFPQQLMVSGAITCGNLGHWPWWKNLLANGLLGTTLTAEAILGHAGLHPETLQPIPGIEQRCPTEWRGIVSGSVGGGGCRI